MTQDNTPTPEPTPAHDEAAQIEDADAPDAETAEDIAEDDPLLLSGAVRIIQPDEDSGSEEVVSPIVEDSPRRRYDDTSDAAAIQDEPAQAGSKESNLSQPDWATEVSARKIGIELKHIEENVRHLLDGRDTRRKRKLGGTRRWHELEEDIINWRHAGRIDGDTLDRLHEMIARRHHLFQRLRFLAGTRPTWNS
jgi:hypothetical protein